ncbi:MAG: hypothetical protein RR275_05295 [Lachnospiraceae bacterium]
MEIILNSIFEKDIPQQFHDKPMIEELVRSYTIQLEELKQVFYDLDNKTDIDTAEGSVLDDVGNIPVLSRKEAGLIARIGVEDPVMSDDRYRQFLKYKVLENTNECTYRDLMDGLSLLWDISPIYYEENPALPAVIILTMPFLTPGGKVVTLGEVPMVKSSGVRIEFQYYIKAVIEIAFNFSITTYDVPRCNTLTCGTYPKRATLGTIIAIECETDANSIMQAFDSNPSGTVRIGGGAYSSTLGSKYSEDIEIEVNSKMQIVDVVRAGQSISGIHPAIAAKGIVIPQDISLDGIVSATKYTPPLSGKKTSGGGTMEEAALIYAEEGLSVDNNIQIGAATQRAASAKTLCGTNQKGVSVSLSEAESDVNVYIAAATMRRCGTKTCGNKE